MAFPARKRMSARARRAPSRRARQRGADRPEAQLELGSPRAVLACAEERCHAQSERLTRLRRDLLTVLALAPRPLGAYAIVEQLGSLQGREIAPITAYRGLEFLTRLGLVSRLESQKAFVLCAHPHLRHDCIFLLCRSCGEVQEIVDQRLTQLLDADAAEAAFVPERRVVEIHGLCRTCRSDPVLERDA